ncbi:MAG: septum formation initiator family protein [Candidatus Aureabacteria bacterium]|nr:septum formation initiator family protein [Candidatus Auribacterota bacterium]
MGKGTAHGRTVWYGAALVLGLALSWYFFLMPLLGTKRLFRTRVDELRRGIVAGQEAHRKLQRERRLLEENDPAYLERYARDNFGWAREGEIIYKLDRER